MSAFTDHVHISIDGFTQNVIYYDLQVSQKMADHHHFSFLWQYTGKPIIEPEDQEKAFSSYTGSELIFTFKINGVKVMSKGKIKRLDSIDLHGSPVGLHVTGISHTIGIDEMKKSRIFLEKNLQQIGLEILAEETSGEFYKRESIVPTFTQEFKYKTQYNETNFDFLKRLSARYGQWFYFDGMRMQFGQLKSSNVTLINESSLHNFRIEAHLVSHKTSFAGYDYHTAANIKNASERTETGSKDRFATMVKFKQSHIAQQGLKNGPYTNNAQNEKEIQQMVKLQTAGHDANSIFYSGTSYLPIGLGQTFTIQNKKVEHHLVAIEIVHRSEVNGNYTCEFRAIPVDVSAPHYTDVTVFATAENQSAIVIDNNDPEKLGRVKVEYYWNTWDAKSDWMRVVQPYAGSGKGLYFRPVTEEEVLISFEGGNAERPYVSGTYYNGKEMPDFFDPQNSIKGWKLRFGQLFKFIEKIGIWLSDPSGNEIHLDEENKNINMTAPETVTFNCKNFVINASESITLNAAKDITSDALANHTIKAGGIITQSAIGDYNVIAFNINESATGKRNSQAENIQEQAGNIQKHAIDENVNVQGQKKIIANSGENTNFF